MTKTFCVFGDSVTQAAYIPENWVNQLRRYLENKYRDDFIEVFNLGIGGNTTPDILKRFENEASARNPNFLIFAVGINDTKYTQPSNFKTNLLKLIMLAKKDTREIFFVGLVLGDWTGDEPFSQKKTNNFNQILKETADTTGVNFIDLQGVLTPNDFSDGLHPNVEGHKKMFETIKTEF